MERLLIFIKHHFGFLWSIIERVNSIGFSLLFKSKMLKALPGVIHEFSELPFSYRKLVRTDAVMLHKLIHAQKSDDLIYFNPHGFDPISIDKQFSNSAFLMMGAFHEERLVGYFFLRLFANRKCFVGRLIDIDYRGKGIGKVMNNIMYETAWRIGFRCLSTISRKNKAVMRAHSKNSSMEVLKELNNDYLLVEFRKR